MKSKSKSKSKYLIITVTLRLLPKGFLWKTTCLPRLRVAAVAEQGRQAGLSLTACRWRRTRLCFIITLLHSLSPSVFRLPTSFYSNTSSTTLVQWNNLNLVVIQVGYPYISGMNQYGSRFIQFNKI